MGVLGFAFASPERAEVWVGAYYNELLKRRQQITDYQINPNIAVASYFMCAPTDKLAKERSDGCTFFEYSLGQYSRKNYSGAGGASLWDRYIEWRATEDGRAQDTSALGLIGSPERLRSRLRKMQATHVDQVILLVQTGRTNHEHMCEALELFANDVMPEFHDAEDEHQAWKAAVLTGDLELMDPDEDELAVDGQRIPGPVQRPERRVADQVAP
jgi:hypothetical protein